MPITVLLVDGHAIVRSAVAEVLRPIPGVSVVGEAGTGQDAIKLARLLQPQVVVLDVALPDLGGDVVARRILAESPSCRVVALSGFNDRQHALEMLQAGALGYVVKGSTVDELVTAIESVTRAQRYVSPDIANALWGFLTEAERGPNACLTERERDVVRLVAQGLATKAVARELRISAKTVEAHRRNVMSKLQIFSTAGLTKYAIREGIATLY